jgi:lipopolysaccharide export LptBFGC system permease protein LptF
MKLVLRILLVVAIIALVYLCVQSILTPIDFEKQQKVREKAISNRLIEIRNAQIGYKNAKGVYAANFEELQKFLNETKIPFLIKEGELTDEQLKEGMTEQEAVKKGIIRRDTNWVLAKDTLLGRDYNVAMIGKVPGFENHTFLLDTATLSSPSSGYTVPVFQCAVSYDVYLGDLDKQLLFNLKEKATKLNHYVGLRVGSITEINNNAGNWEQF